MKAILHAAAMALSLAAPALAQVERANFDTSPFSLGTLTETEGALPRDLWEGADAEAVRTLLEAVPTQFADGTKRLILRRILLSPGNGPRGADAGLAALKLRTAAKAGYVMEAGALAELNPGLRVQPALTEIIATRDLYRGDLNEACGLGANLREGRQQPFFVKLRAFCYIAADQVPAAELTISLAREEGVLTPEDEAMYAALFSGRTPTAFPRNALQYAAYRRLLGLFAPGDVQEVAPAVAAAIALDPGLSVPARLEALKRAARERLLPDRDLADVAATLDGTALAREIARVRAMPGGSDAQNGEIGSILFNHRTDPDAFYLRTRIFERELASMAPGVSTVPYAAEIGLASLLIRRFDNAERWMQAVAAEQTLEAERAFLNLAKLYSYLNRSAAQRLAGAIGEELPPPPAPKVAIDDASARGSAALGLAEATANGILAASTGSRAASLLAALAASGATVSGEEVAVRDALGQALYKAGGAEPLVLDALFEQEALAFVGQLREGIVNRQPYIPRLKPQRSGGRR